MHTTQTTLQPRLEAPAAADHTTRVSQARGVVLWLVALSEAAARHLSSTPLSLLLCCWLRMYVRCVVRAAINSAGTRYQVMRIFSNIIVM